MRLVSWNIAGREACWDELLSTDYDVALVQEARQPRDELLGHMRIDPGDWSTAGGGKDRPWKATIAVLNSELKVEWIAAFSIDDAKPGDLAVSRLGTIAAAHITDGKSEPVTVISVYAPWENVHADTNSAEIYADGSAHRIVSDISNLVARQKGHRILVAGDWNILFGYGERGNKYWANRYASVFQRMEGLGLHLVGPCAPNGRQADPWPSELPEDSLCVPTYHTRSMTPATAQRQIVDEDGPFISACIRSTKLSCSAIKG